MSFQGTVGPWELDFLDPPTGRTGRGRVRARLKSGGDWRDLTVSWVIDSQGIRVELPGEVRAFDARASVTDEGTTQFQLLGRGMAGEWTALRFVRRGEETGAAAGAGARKASKIKAQMPGKIVKVLVEMGAEVEKGQVLLVMEAMKMENEIKATGPGKITQVSVAAGQAVETGALLVVIE